MTGGSGGSAHGKACGCKDKTRQGLIYTFFTYTSEVKNTYILHDVHHVCI